VPHNESQMIHPTQQLSGSALSISSNEIVAARRSKPESVRRISEGIFAIFCFTSSGWEEIQFDFYRQKQGWIQYLSEGRRRPVI
jgi:hypothetical protein